MKVLILSARLNERRWLAAVSELNKKVDLLFLTSRSLEKEYEFCKYLPVFISSSWFGHNALEIPNPYIFKKIVRTYKPDIVHIFGEPNYPHVSMALKYSNCKVTCRMAQNIFQNWPFPFNMMEKRSLERLDHVFPVSKISEALLQKKGFAGNKTIVGNGYNDDIFYKRDDISKEGLLYVGKVIKRKGVRDLVKALKFLKDKNINVSLTIISGSSDSESKGVEMNLIKRLIKEFDLEESITIMSRLDHKELRKYFNKSKFVVIPSKRSKGEDWSMGRYFSSARVEWSEQFCMVAVEAMACGTPIIASDSGALPDVIARNDNIFKANDPYDLARVIEHKLNLSEDDYHDEVIHSLKISSQYNWDTVSDSFIASWSNLAR